MTSSLDVHQVPPVEVASQFFTALNEPRPLSLDFSFDGLFSLSSHVDDAVRVVDVCSLTHAVTIPCSHCGVSSAMYTHSSSAVIIAPRVPVDGHLYVLNVETATICGAMAYINDYEPPLALLQQPVYSAIAQCPVSDVVAAVISAKGALAFFHPLMSGAVAVTKDNFVAGRPSLAFSQDGHHIFVGDKSSVSVMDRRMLVTQPVERLDLSAIFSVSPSRCRGIDVCADPHRILVTSSKGEANLFNLQTKATECTYFHHIVKELFDGTPNDVPAKFLNPHQSRSRVVQMTSSMSDGRHLLLYRPSPCAAEETIPTRTGQMEDGKAQPASRVGVEGGDGCSLAVPQRQKPVEGVLRYQFQSKDSEVPVAIAVNPRFQLIATAARHVTWWNVNENE